jgi:hypothetical protein
MSTVALTLSVDQEIAQAFASAKPEEQKKIQLLLGLRLRELTVGPRRSLDEIMDEAGAEATRNGLTPEILSELLNGE